MGAEIGRQAGQLRWQRGVRQFGSTVLTTLAPRWAGERMLDQFLTPERHPPSPKAQRFLDSAAKLAVKHNEQTLMGYVWGEGPTVLLVHGWEASASSLRAFVTPLTAHGFRVVALDGPAHGASPGVQTNLLDFGEAIRRTIEQIGPVHGIIAHSFGGAATMLMLANHLHTLAENVVLIGAPSELANMMDEWARARGVSQPVVEGMHQAVTARFGQTVEAFSVAMVAPSVKSAGLIVHDEGDEAVPFQEAEAIARAWVGAKLVATSGLGHRGPLRSLNVIRQIVRFLVDAREGRDSAQ